MNEQTAAGGNLSKKLMPIGDVQAVRLITLIAAAVILPFLILAALTWIWPPDLKTEYQLPLSTLSHLRRAVSSTMHGWSGNDSFWTMNQAITALNGPMRGQLYETLFFRDHIRFQYPVSSLIPLIALNQIGLSGERVFNAINDLFFVANAVTNGALAWLLFPVGGPAKRARSLRIAMAVLSAIATLTFLPLLRAQFLGQLQLWIDFLFSASILFWCLDYKIISGVLIGAICTLKPQMVLLLLWGLIWRQWKFVAGILALSILALAVSISMFGLNNNLQYLEVIKFLSRHGESFYTNNSLNGILNWYAVGLDEFNFHTKAFAPYHSYIAVYTAIATLASLAAIVLPRLFSQSRVANVFGLGAAAICTVWGAPIAWDHHYGILFPLYLISIRYLIFSERHAAAGAAIVFTSWIFVANFISYAYLSAGTSFAVVQAYCFFGAIILSGYLAFAASNLPRDWDSFAAASPQDQLSDV